MIEHAAAHTEIKALFWEAFSVLRPDVEVRWADKEETAPPSSALWVSFELIDALGRQTSFSDSSLKRYTSFGAVLVRCYGRKSQPNANEAVKAVAAVVQNIFSGVDTPGGVWFRNPSIKTVPMESLYYRENVTIDFQFDSMR